MVLMSELSGFKEINELKIKYHKKVVKKLKRCERVDLNLINSSANIIYSE